ncbi:hypothetical protein E2320_009385 [Naja naja]|nr:hypothetical protein E2320_009385 [Naja naja]
MGPGLWGTPEESSGAERGIALPSPGWCTLEVDYNPQEAQLACQLVMQTCGSTHLECTRREEARASRGGCAAGALLHVGTEGSSRTGQAARQSNPLGVLRQPPPTKNEAPDFAYHSRSLSGETASLVDIWREGEGPKLSFAPPITLGPQS